MQWHARIRQPRQPGVPEIVAAEVFVAEADHHVVPVGCVPQDRTGPISRCRGRRPWNASGGEDVAERCDEARVEGSGCYGFATPSSHLAPFGGEAEQGPWEGNI
ncbi:hypothetical protein GCM10010441_73740 [Kitasatospora paracochleata]